MAENFHKPTQFSGSKFESLKGGEDPAHISRVAHETAHALLARVRSDPDPDTVERLVAYTDETLQDLLGVEADLVSRHGAVSGPVVEAMARAARQRCRSDFAVAIAAVIDGSGVTETGPSVGTAIWAIADPDGSIQVAERLIPASDREIIQVRGAAFALESLRRHLVAQLGAGAPVAQVTP